MCRVTLPRQGRGPTTQEPANPLNTDLQELQAVRASGARVKETSYYPAVSGLFNAYGKTLKPSVRCIINLKNTGAGIPDGGFFTPDQFGKEKGPSAPSLGDQSRNRKTPAPIPLPSPFPAPRNWGGGLPDLRKQDPPPPQTRPSNPQTGLRDPPTPVCAISTYQLA